MEKQGIENLKEVLKFVTVLGVLIGNEATGDGLDYFDFLKLLGNEEFKVKLAEAISGIELVPAEAADLSVNEGFELTLLAIEGVKEILEAFSKKEVAA